MFNLKKSIMFLGIGVLLIFLCKLIGTKIENSMREVSSAFRGLTELELTEKEWKESGISYEDAPIEFHDSIVEVLLRSMIGKTEGEVYISDLQNIHEIHLDGEELGGNVHDLEDLSYCYNLQCLGFSQMEIPSLKSLYNLPQLETLYFSAGASVTKETLSEIGLLPMLKKLRIGNSELTHWGNLTDGSFLLPLAEQLIVLEAQGDIEWSSEVLAQMINLEVLFLENVEDLSFLEHMTKMRKLWLYCCTPEEWGVFSFLENLEYLTIRGNMNMIVEIDLEDLRALKKLDYLSLGYTSINKEYSYQEVVDALPSLTGYHVY